MSLRPQNKASSQIEPSLRFMVLYGIWIDVFKLPKTVEWSLSHWATVRLLHFCHIHHGVLGYRI